MQDDPQHLLLPNELLALISLYFRTSTAAPVVWTRYALAVFLPTRTPSPRNAALPNFSQPLMRLAGRLCLTSKALNQICWESLEELNLTAPYTCNLRSAVHYSRRLRLFCVRVDTPAAARNDLSEARYSDICSIVRNSTESIRELQLVRDSSEFPAADTSELFRLISWCHNLEILNLAGFNLEVDAAENSQEAALRFLVDLTRSLADCKNIRAVWLPGGLRFEQFTQPTVDLEPFRDASQRWQRIFLPASFFENHALEYYRPFELERALSALVSPDELWKKIFVCDVISVETYSPVVFTFESILEQMFTLVKEARQDPPHPYYLGCEDLLERVLVLDVDLDSLSGSHTHIQESLVFAMTDVVIPLWRRGKLSLDRRDGSFHSLLTLWASRFSWIGDPFYEAATAAVNEELLREMRPTLEQLHSCDGRSVIYHLLAFSSLHSEEYADQLRLFCRLYPQLTATIDFALGLVCHSSPALLLRYDGFRPLFEASFGAITEEEMPQLMGMPVAKFVF